MSPRYWYCSATARLAVEAEIARDGRRRWNPLSDSPSLATLQGKAKSFGRSYERSRARLFEKVGVDCTYRYHYFRTTRARRLVGIVKLRVA